MGPRRAPINLLSLIAWVIFIVVLLAAGASFFYQSYLSGAIASDQQSLNLTQGEFDTATINQIIRLDSRLNTAGTLLSGHSATSNVFAELQNITLQTVRFSNFNFSSGNQNILTLTMNGEANSFSDVALQSAAFNKTPYFKNLVVTGLTVEQSGLVSFNMTMTVDPSLIVYQPPAGGTGASVGQVVPSVTQAPTVASSTATISAPAAPATPVAATSSAVNTPHP